MPAYDEICAFYRIIELAKQYKLLALFGKVHIVTVPTESSVLCDILLEVDVQSLLHQTLGGLDPKTIWMATLDGKEAHDAAEKLLRLRRRTTTKDNTKDNA